MKYKSPTYRVSAPVVTRQFMLSEQRHGARPLWVQDISLLEPPSGVDKFQIIGATNLVSDYEIEGEVVVEVIHLLGELGPEVPHLFLRQFPTDELGADSDLLGDDVGKLLHRLEYLVVPPGRQSTVLPLPC